jgi:hypothetical protein
VLTTARHLTLSRDRLTQSISSYHTSLRSIQHDHSFYAFVFQVVSFLLLPSPKHCTYLTSHPTCHVSPPPSSVFFLDLIMLTIFNDGHRVLFPGIKRPGPDADPNLFLVPRSTMGGAVPPPNLCASLACNGTVSQQHLMASTNIGARNTAVQAPRCHSFTSSPNNFLRTLFSNTFSPTF